jgi:hypothetical protein
MRSLMIVSVVAGVGHRGFADEVIQPEPIRLVYTAPAGCPDDAAFFAAVTRRARAVRVDDSAARIFEVSIADANGAVRGTLAVTTADGKIATREVSGATCDETASGLALTTALAIEERIERVAPPPPVAPSPRWHLVTGAGLAVHTGLTPRVIFGAPVFVSVGRERGWRIRAELVRTERQDLAMSAGNVDFQWTAGRLDACPFALELGLFDVSPCVGLEGGILVGHGTEVAMPAGGARPWIAPDAALRWRIKLGRVAVELEGLVAAPLVRDRFFIAPNTTVHQVPAATTSLAASLAVELM